VRKLRGQALTLLSWWRNWHSIRSAGLALYKRGLARANQHDGKNAMECYTAAIEMVDIPDDVRAMALYNRALLHASNKDFSKAELDLNAVLAVPAALQKIKSAARQKLDRIKRGHVHEGL
jgi:hypothetical protein